MEVKRLIITADDFGLSPGVNDAVVAAHRAGTLTSASLMANMDGFQHAVGALAGVPNLDVGLHFVLAADAPVSKPADVPSLVDAQGKFLTRGALLRRGLRRHIRAEDVERELSAQLDALTAAGVTPSFINGDQHVHILPGVRDTVIARAAKLGIATRVPSERTVWQPRGAAPISWVLLAPRLATKAALGQLARTFARQCRAAGVATNEGFVSPFGIVPTARFDAPAFIRVLGGMVDGLNEFMVHPAYPDVATAVFWKGGERQAADRKLELDALLAPAFASALRETGAALTSYGER
jgi:predicted glycoside hydrolase/deacetylase ChbG (UPF0249 family)